MNTKYRYSLPRTIFFLFTATFFFCSCSVLRNSPKYGFTEGYYTNRVLNARDKKVYAVPAGDTIKVYFLEALRKPVVDTIRSLNIAFPQNEKPPAFHTYLFRKNSFD